MKPGYGVAFCQHIGQIRCRACPHLNMLEALAARAVCIRARCAAVPAPICTASPEPQTSGWEFCPTESVASMRPLPNTRSSSGEASADSVSLTAAASARNGRSSNRAA